MSSGSDEYWRRVREAKSVSIVHDHVCDLIRLLKRLDVIKRTHYKEEYMSVSWDQAAKRFIERNWRFHV